jgi:hypothetical protein
MTINHLKMEVKNTKANYRNILCNGQFAENILI